MKSTIIFVVGILTLMGFSKAYACDCVYYKLEQSIKFTDLVLVGRFIQGEKVWELSELDKNNPMLYYTGRFVVENVLKGTTIKVGDTLKVTTDHTNCSTLYKNETNYILFIEGQNIQSSTCSYTRALNNEDGKKIFKQTKRILRKRLLTLHCRKWGLDVVTSAVSRYQLQFGA